MKFESSCEMGRVCVCVCVCEHECILAWILRYVRVCARARVCVCVCVDVFKAQVSYESRLITAL